MLTTVTVDGDKCYGNGTESVCGAMLFSEFILTTFTNSNGQGGCVPHKGQQKETARPFF